MKVELSLYEIWELHGAMNQCECEGTSDPRTDMKHLFEAELSQLDSWFKLKFKLEEILNTAMTESTQMKTFVHQPRPCEGPNGRLCFVCCPECQDTLLERLEKEIESYKSRTPSPSPENDR